MTHNHYGGGDPITPYAVAFAILSPEGMSVDDVNELNRLILGRNIFRDTLQIADIALSMLRIMYHAMIEVDVRNYIGNIGMKINMDTHATMATDVLLGSILSFVMYVSKRYLDDAVPISATTLESMSLLNPSINSSWWYREISRYADTHSSLPYPDASGIAPAPPVFYGVEEWPYDFAPARLSSYVFSSDYGIWWDSNKFSSDYDANLFNK